MYCKACTRVVSAGDELKDKRGCTHTHQYQLCSKCRPEPQMSESEVRMFLKELVEATKAVQGD